MITFIAYMIQGWIPIQMALSLGKKNITRAQWIGLSAIALWNVAAGLLSLAKLSLLRLYLVEEDASKYHFHIPCGVPDADSSLAWRRVILVEIGL